MGNSVRAMRGLLAARMFFLASWVHWDAAGIFFVILVIFKYSRLSGLFLTFPMAMDHYDFNQDAVSEIDFKI